MAAYHVQGWYKVVCLSPDCRPIVFVCCCADSGLRSPSRPDRRRFVLKFLVNLRPADVFVRLSRIRRPSPVRIPLLSFCPFQSLSRVRFAVSPARLIRNARRYLVRRVHRRW